MDYENARNHIGHDVECAAYGPPNEDPWNIAIECMDCGTVIVDVDHPDMEQEGLPTLL